MMGYALSVVLLDEQIELHAMDVMMVPAGEIRWHGSHCRSFS
jgi:hypothetical protein